MANEIVAADVTRVIRNIWRLDTGQSSGEPLIAVNFQLVITTSAGHVNYDTTNKVPLTNLFTTDNASDCYLDVLQPITQMGLGYLIKDSSTVTKALVVAFRKGGSTAATQQVLLYAANDTAGTAGQPLNELGTGNTNVDLTNAVNFGANSVCVADITLVGRKRPNITIPGVAF